jgi:hypothetical protein
MTNAKEYATPKAFRTALETRIATNHRADKIPIERIRKQISFDRLLARLFSKKPSLWLLKGGYAMQLRILNARATKDVDLAMREFKIPPGADVGLELLAYIQEQLKQSQIPDFFEFVISGPILDLDAPPYGGARFLVEARIDNRTFEKFHLDIGIGDVWMDSLEQLASPSWLEFAGIAAETFPAIAKEQQFAEKIHAYTVPRPDGSTNTRVKDLVDMVLLISSGNLSPSKLITAIDATYKRRATHEFRVDLMPPPDSWVGPYAKLAAECEISTDVATGFKIAHDFVKTLST